MSTEEDDKKKKDDDDLEIEVVDDTPPEDQGRKASDDDEDKKKKASEEDRKPDEEEESDDDFSDDDQDEHNDELAGYSDRVKKRINKLRYDYHEERRSKEAAERMRQEAIEYAKRVTEENRKLREQGDQSRQHLVSSRLERVEALREQWRRTLQTAHEEGDYEKVSEAQEKLAELVAEKAQLTAWEARAKAPKPDAENRHEAQRQQGQQNQGQQPPAADPMAVAWLKRNDWFGRDTEMTGFAYGYHERLVKEGVDPRSEEYYRRIDKRVREVFPDHFDEGTSRKSKKDAATRRSSPVASADRSGSKSRKVQLTATQIALAKRLGITPEQYARELLKEQQNGAQ